jgi:hypothetical protein
MPPLPGLVEIGIDTAAVPVAGFTSNFSPMPPIDPPPFGREMDGAESGKDP